MHLARISIVLLPVLRQADVRLRFYSRRTPQGLPRIPVSAQRRRGRILRAIGEAVRVGVAHMGRRRASIDVDGAQCPPYG